MSQEKQTCIKDKKFLFFKWREIEHDFKMFSISKFMYCSTTFTVRNKWGQMRQYLTGQ